MDEDYYWWYTNSSIEKKRGLGYYIEKEACDSLLNCAKNRNKH